MHTDSHLSNTANYAPRFAIGENVALTMSSREMSELTGKRHDSVKRTIEALAFKTDKNGDPAPVIGVPQIVEYLDTLGRPANEYHVSKRDSFVVVAQLCPEFTARIVDRWQELEAQQAKVPELSTMDILQIAMESERGRLLAIEQRDHAIQTKAQIGAQREATAMNTASQAVKKVHQLEVELDKSKQYATVKRMEMLHHGQPFSWRLLKSAAAEMGIPAIDVFDANYGTVKAYHADVWREVYAVPPSVLRA